MLGATPYAKTPYGSSHDVELGIHRLDLGKNINVGYQFTLWIDFVGGFSYGQVTHYTFQNQTIGSVWIHPSSPGSPAPYYADLYGPPQGETYRLVISIYGPESSFYTQTIYVHHATCTPGLPQVTVYAFSSEIVEAGPVNIELPIPEFLSHVEGGGSINVDGDVALQLPQIAIAADVVAANPNVDGTIAFSTTQFQFGILTSLFLSVSTRIFISPPKITLSIGMPSEMEWRTQAHVRLTPVTGSASTELTTVVVSRIQLDPLFVEFTADVYQVGRVETELHIGFPGNIALQAWTLWSDLNLPLLGLSASGEVSSVAPASLDVSMPEAEFSFETVWTARASGILSLKALRATARVDTRSGSDGFLEVVVSPIILTAAGAVLETFLQVTTFIPNLVVRTNLQLTEPPVAIVLGEPPHIMATIEITRAGGAPTANLFAVQLANMGVSRVPITSPVSLAVAEGRLLVATSEGVYSQTTDVGAQVIVLPTIDLRTQVVDYLSHAILLGVFPQGGEIRIVTELNEDYTYPIRKTSVLSEQIVRFGRGFKGRMYIATISAIGATIHVITVFIDRRQIRRR